MDTANQLAESRLALLDHFLDEHEAAAVLARLVALRGEGRFRRAGVGSGQVADEIRRDELHWLDREELPWLWARFDEVRETLNRTLYLGLKSFEGHFAVYPTGAYYRRHRDQHRGKDARVVSAILYLN